VSSTVTVGTSPFGVAVNPVTNTIYVPNAGDDTVSVIDGITGSLISTIGVGEAPGAVAVNSSTNTVYVTHEGAATVSVIDGATGAVVSTLTVGAWPYAVAVNETTNTVYTANLSHSMSVIDGVTRAVDTIAVGPSNSQLTGIAVNEATNTVYASVYINGRLWQIAGATHVVSPGIAVGAAPFGVAVYEATNTVYVANVGSASVSVVNGATRVVDSVIPVGVGPFGVAVDATGNTVFVTNGGGGGLSVIDGATGTVAYSVAVGTNPHGVALNVSTNTVYVTNSGDNNVAVLRAVGAPSITTGTLPGGTVGAAYSATVEATGVAPIVWTVRSGALPAGLTLDASTGVISGTPTSPGSATFTVMAKSDAGADFQTLTVDTTAAALAVTGLETLPWSVGGALALFAGALLLALQRKRRRSDAV
jgi:YVTN family beta-propeller protein